MAGLLATLGLLACASTPAQELPAVPIPASLELAFEPTPTLADAAFLRGLIALKLQDYARARSEMGSVASACAGDPIGARAALALAAAELDPRNPVGDPGLARALVERVLQLPEKPAWTEPVAETLYLLALDRGGGSPPADPPEAREDPESGRERADRFGEEGDPFVPAREARVLPDAEPREDDPLLVLASPELAPTPEDCARASDTLRGGALEAPILPRTPLAEQMAGLERDRDALQASAEELERELAELRQELERIRETLRP